MIIRKPYAFLIKNFRKIHIVLLIVGIFVFYKMVDIVGFVNSFMSDGVYESYANPVTNHITTGAMTAIWIMIIGSFSLMFLLLHKKKPWKTYLIPSIIYLVLLMVLSMIKGFFGTYTEVIEATNLRLASDLLKIFMIGQIPALAVFVIRIFGLDVKKFEFNSDIEMLDLSDEDREEIELSLDFDISTVKRYWKKLIRNVGYFYKEHTLICKAIIGALCLIILYNAFVFIFVTNRTYRQGQSYKVDGFTFKVNNSYITDKDYKGDVIRKGSKFVIVEMTVVNNGEPRTLDTNLFHLKAGKRNYETTETTYAKEFEDLGKCYSKVKTLQRDEESTFLLIYKVDSKIGKGRFDLYYQERGGIFKLRKISLRIKNIGNISWTKKLNIGDSFDVPIKGKEDTIGIADVQFSKKITYHVQKCTYQKCTFNEVTYETPANFRTMEITFSSNSYETKNMIDFFKKYGRISYKDSNGIDRDVEVKVAITKSYLGKTIYLNVPEDFYDCKEAHISFIVRNKSYSYRVL